ncbi:MAG: hypothetical protein U1F56_17520 [Rubrivivax sp.]
MTARASLRAIRAALGPLLAAMVPLAAGAPPAAADALFDWAERRYPELFAPGAVTQEVDLDFRRFHARHYVATGTYLGLVNGGTVYGLGPFTGGELLDLGSFETYLCQASPAECSPRPAQVLRVRIDAGSRQCEPGSGSSRLEARRRLTDAAVRVSGSDCGYAGVAVPAVCGASDARYWMFDIDAADAARALALGFPPVDAEIYPGRPSARACTY